MATQAVNQHLDSGSRLGLQLQLPEQNKAAISASQRPAPNPEKSAASASVWQNPHRVNANASSSVPRNLGAYQRAILAYQESARLEAQPLFSNESRSDNQELAITNLLRAEPENADAWSDLGLLYHSQGQRDKVSAIYQILKTLDTTKADTFSTQAGLNEKKLFNIV
ncbi:MAG: hypothetical protein AAB035_04195 [Nitrospirota bacterium]